jgi:hypothetical protein
MNDLEKLRKEDYAAWWDGHFPCECGHDSNKHYFVDDEKDGCPGCGECHSDALMAYSVRLTRAMH